MQGNFEIDESETEGHETEEMITFRTVNRC